jgi:hypothetical protein
VGDEARHVEIALKQRDHPVPGLEHLAAVDALKRQHLEDDLVPVDLEGGGCDAEDRDPAAVVHHLDHVAEGLRGARHLEADVEALAHALRGHHVAQGFARGIDHRADAEATREFQPGGVDVGDHHLPGADAAGHERTHDADRAGAGHQHVLAHQIERERRVHRVAEGIEDRPDFIGNVLGDRHHVVLRDREVFGEGAGTLHAHSERVSAQVSAARPTVAAVAADDMALARDPLAQPVLGHRAPEIGDLAHELVADHHRNRHRSARPLVPVVDMHVGAADRALANPDQHVVGTDLGHRHLLHPDARLGSRLDQRLHQVRHSVLPCLTQ